jgi:threonine dehydrogenase-like Zn-dependent dehydrogenase
MPDALAEKMMQKPGVDRLHALHLATDIVRRGGTIYLIGVYGGIADPPPMMTLFDSRSNCAWARRTSKQDGAIKILLQP